MVPSESPVDKPVSFAGDFETAGREDLPAGEDWRSFRDPAGCLLRQDGRIVRLVRAEGVADFEAYEQSATTRRMVEEGRLVRTWPGRYEHLPHCRPEDSAIFPLVLEHDRIRFPNYPHEWPPEMLGAAAKLTLELAQGWLSEGLGLKDSTPFNVMFRAATPVFLDVLSCERRDARDPTWLAQAQFVRTFLLPLMAFRFLGMQPHSVFLTDREGLEAETVYRWLRPWQRLRPLVMHHVSIPVWLSGASAKREGSLYAPRRVRNPEQARFVLESMFGSLERALRVLSPSAPAKSGWSDYMSRAVSYEKDQFEAKERFVRTVLERIRPARVLDVGCNTGHFSRLAAARGAEVVAIDSDPAVVGEVWRESARRNENILPLVVNVARPAPPLGWRNRECLSFLGRAEGYFDCVLMLAVLHHLLVTERIPLEEVLEEAARLSTRHVVMEFIGTGDPLFRRLARGREALHAHISKDHFENVAARRFRVALCQRVPGAERWLYLLERR